MRILFYGRLAEAIGAELEVDIVAGSSVGSIRERLASEHPAAANTLRNGRALTCVGGSFVPDEYLVRAKDRVEFLPPLSGG